MYIEISPWFLFYYGLYCIITQMGRPQDYQKLSEGWAHLSVYVLPEKIATSVAIHPADAGHEIFRLWVQYHSFWCTGS